MTIRFAVIVVVAFVLSGCGESVSERSANQKRDYKIDDVDRSTEQRLKSLEDRVTFLEKR